MIINFHTHSALKQVEGKAVRNIIVGRDLPLVFASDECYSAGIHPWYIHESNVALQLKELKELSSSEQVKFIGECGLDKLRGADLAIQKVVFEEQIKIAEELNKPLIVHCVKAYSELLEIKKRLNPAVPLVIHGFNNKTALGRQLLNAGFLFSIGTAILSKGSNAENFLAIIPNNCLFLENDDKDIAIEKVYEAAARVRKTTLKLLEDTIFANWLSLTNES